MAGHRTRSAAEIANALDDQLSFLRDSASAFDSGKTREARRIAGALYQLLHDDTNPKSLTRGLLTQVGSKTKIWYISSARPAHMHPQVRLASIVMNENGTKLVPHCQITGFITKIAPWLTSYPFATWWEEAIYLHRGREVSRKDLVLSVRNQDGGGHFNPELRDRGYPYAEMVDEADPTMSFGGKPMPDAHLVSLRQIAWELDASLTRFQG